MTPGLPVPFTYPPIAAVVLAPRPAPTPMTAAGTVLTLASIALAAVVLRLVLRRLAGPFGASLWAVGWPLLATLLLEPVRSTLAYGQINVVLMALVALDCLTAVAPRWPRGALTGLAAAVKLTPAAFVLFFLLRRDYRAAATAGFVLRRRHRRRVRAGRAGLGALLDRDDLRDRPDRQPGPLPPTSPCRWSWPAPGSPCTPCPPRPPG